MASDMEDGSRPASSAARWCGTLMCSAPKSVDGFPPGFARPGIGWSVEGSQGNLRRDSQLLPCFTALFIGSNQPTHARRRESGRQALPTKASITVASALRSTPGRGLPAQAQCFHFSSIRETTPWAQPKAHIKRLLRRSSDSWRTNHQSLVCRGPCKAPEPRDQRSTL